MRGSFLTTSGLTEQVAKAFESACDKDGITHFLSDTVSYFAATQGAVIICPISNPEELLPITCGIEGPIIRDWLLEGSGRQAIIERIGQFMSGDTFNGRDEWQSPDPLATQMLCSIATIDERNICLLILWRRMDQPAFSEPEAATLSSLSGYFRRAIDINSRFVDIYSEHKNAVAVLDQAPRAVFIIGQHGQPTYQNAEARRIASMNDGLTADSSRILISDEVASSKVSDYLQQITSTDSDQFIPHRISTVIRRKSGEAPYKLLMYTLPSASSQTRFNENEGLAVLLVHDPETLLDLNTDLLKDYYNLTRAESALARALFIGNTLMEASDALGISINTSRTQLRNIFRKVGVNSQASLLQEFAKSMIQS